MTEIGQNPEYTLCASQMHTQEGGVYFMLPGN
jgi:hypothetical protein